MKTELIILPIEEKLLEFARKNPLSQEELRIARNALSPSSAKPNRLKKVAFFVMALLGVRP